MFTKKELILVLFDENDGCLAQTAFDIFVINHKLKPKDVFSVPFSRIF